MSKKRRVAAVASLMAAAGLVSSTQAYGNVVIGNWTAGTGDGWIDWTTQSGYAGGPTTLPTPKYTYAVDGEVPGDPTGDSLVVTHSGYNQSLAVKLEYVAGGMSDFWKYDEIQFQMTVPVDNSNGSGYSQIYQLFVNAPGWGFTNIASAKPVPGSNFYFYTDSGQRTATVTVSYAAVLSAMEADGYNSTTNQGYAEIIFATNNGSGAPDSVSFDQVSLVPEPASLSMLGLAAAGLLSRRRHRR